MTRSDAPLVIGFDLDMTLVDSRAGIRRVYDELSARTGVTIDSELVVSRLGPPLESELAHWFNPIDVPRAAALYRSIYPDLAIERVAALPGARDALAAVAETGRAVVITAKAEQNARRHVEHLGLAVDDVVGDVWRAQKGEVLRWLGAAAYAGDHVHDMDAARLAGVPGIGVATGPCDRAALEAAGAAVVLTSLGGFRAWFSEHLLAVQ
ncbi:HAD family hydrolase [Aeromicrobium phragmitis]|uniref:HAD family hydrolase n=1 Tax=Aeromicrobium phragmitis TaxID=2478914 RepID=A0A3L8PPB3_9ACTN|nr:HAD hydrolase-like protein [Aeromicrobium phragmitis]RLV56543.1 HAD family hydrolase [Aeromicrobium phragmitis]